MAGLTRPGEQKRLVLVAPEEPKCRACGDFGTIEKPGYKRKSHTLAGVVDHEVLCTCAASDFWRAFLEEWSKPVFDRWGNPMKGVLDEIRDEMPSL